MSIQLWLLYLAAAVGLSLAPGPNGLLALAHGARYGLRPAAWTVFGGALGFFVLVALSLAGLGALLAASERAFVALKWAGAVYLVYLGLRTWRAPVPAFAPGRGPAGAIAPPRARLFAQGAVAAVSNPKGMIFFAAFLPQFIVPGTSYGAQLLVFGGTFVVVEIVYELVLAGLAGRIAPWLGRHGRWFNRATGATFVGMGTVLATAERS